MGTPSPPKKNQARKKSTKIKFLGPETARWGGGLPREGVVAENFVPALETLSSLGFEERNPGCPGNFARMSRTPGGVQKVCAKNLRAHFSFPKKVKLKYPPPHNDEFCGHGGFPAERTQKSQEPRKLAQPFPALELWAKDFTDLVQEPPRQTKPKRGPKRKVHEFRPFL